MFAACLPSTTFNTSCQLSIFDFFEKEISRTVLVTVLGVRVYKTEVSVGICLQTRPQVFRPRHYKNTRNSISDKIAVKTLSALRVERVRADGGHQDEVNEADGGSWAVFINTDTEDIVSP